MGDHEELHAAAVALAIDCDGPLAGVLILGDSGAGKSSLALSLIDTCPFRRTALVADDIVILNPVAGGVSAYAPERLKGLIEARGFGPAPVKYVSNCNILFAVDLSALGERVPTGEASNFFPGNWPCLCIPLSGMVSARRRLPACAL